MIRDKNEMKLRCRIDAEAKMPCDYCQISTTIKYNQKNYEKS